MAGLAGPCYRPAKGLNRPPATITYPEPTPNLPHPPGQPALPVQPGVSGAYLPRDRPSCKRLASREQQPAAFGQPDAGHNMPKLNRLPPRIQPLDAPRGGWADHRRGSATERGYGWQWDKLRRRVLERDAGLCQPCMRRGHVTPNCSTVDHIVNKAQGGGDNSENLQTICEPCHKAKTAAESRGQVWDESAAPVPA